MSTITIVKNNEVFEGFDIRSVKRCTPRVAGLRACAELTAEGDGTVILRLTAETPFGNFSRTFKFNADKEFKFKPVSRVTITVSIKNFKVSDDEISFRLGLESCIEVPIIGKKCKSAIFNIELPMPILAAKSMDELSSGDLALLLLAAKEETCNCH